MQIFAFLFFAACLSAQHFVLPQRNVSYNNEHILIDGKPTLILAGAIHYPRSAPKMWDQLMIRTKEAGLNTVETYVFWNLHETERGVFDFYGNKDLRLFILTAHRHGLYVVLRFGPYVCAEWNYGGFPAWLREIQGLSIRTYNRPFMNEMARFLSHFVEYTKDLFYDQGGPVILLQVENEYGLVEKQYGPKGHRYIEWAVEFAQSLNVSLPWFVCQQDNVPGILNTCNGFYCDSWIGSSRPYLDQPAMFTEDWTGWFTNWGDIRPERPVEDLAFGLSRWIAMGGVYHSYYMWHGGTNFDRMAGWNLTTSYDYDAPLDEFGLPREPKYSHLSRLHHILNENSHLLLNRSKMTSEWLSGQVQAHVFGDYATEDSLVMLSNIATTDVENFPYLGGIFNLPRWSVTFIRGPINHFKILFNTASPETTANEWLYEPLRIRNVTIVMKQEPLGLWNKQLARFRTVPAEHISMTRDKTDYLWYVMPSIPGAKSFQLDISEFGDILYVYWNGNFVGGAKGGYNLSFHIPEAYIHCEEDNELMLLSQTLGIQHFGPFLERARRGLTGTVLMNHEDVTKNGWWHQIGLKGEWSEYNDPDAPVDFPPTSPSDLQNPTSFVWFRIHFDMPASSEHTHFALDMSSMGRGRLWLNGNALGRYWNITTSEPTSPTDPYPKPDIRAEEHVLPMNGTVCDYAGPFFQDKCRNDPAGLPSQRYYHVPSSWLKPEGNMLAVFEELGGRVLDIKLVGVSRGRKESQAILLMQ